MCSTMFSLTLMKTKVTNWQIIFRRIETSNRPSVQTSLEKMRQSAAQMWCLIRFLPQLIGHRVPPTNAAWKVFLLLRTIMDLIFSPTITVDGTYSVQALIEAHHSEFLEVGIIEF